MNNLSDSTIPLLEKFLDVSSQRHQMVTTNIANVDTPGYRTRDIDFHSELERAAAGGPANLIPVVRSVPGLLERPDGNNVSMEREGLLLAETQMQFGLGVQLLRHEFQQLLMAINEGSKA